MNSLLPYIIALFGTSVLIGVHGAEVGWSIIRIALTGVVTSSIIVLIFQAARSVA